MKCTECGSTMKKRVSDHIYRESGMDHVVLHNITKYTCPEDGRTFVQIPAIGKLHRVLAQAIAEKPTRLAPSEVRFLRDQLGLRNTQFAELMGVTPTQSSRWTTSEPIGPQAERFLRMLAVLGPEHVKPDEPPNNVGDIRLQDAEETLDEVTKLIKHLLSPFPAGKSKTIAFRRNSAGWKQDAALRN